MTIKQNGGIFGRKPDFSGITFGGGSEELNHYSEGSWAIDVQDSSGNSATFQNSNGRYVRIGSLVTVTGFITNINTTGLTGSDDVRVYGLPYASNSYSGSLYFNGSVVTNSTSFSGQLTSCFLDSKSYLRIWDMASGTSSNTYLIVSDLTDGAADLKFTFSYFA